MPQSIHQLYAHIIFSTKNREPFLQAEVIHHMHGYLAQLCRDCGSPWVVVGGVADHVHIALDLGKTMPSVALIAKVKKESSSWIKKQDSSFANFYWQRGYGLFSFGHLQKDDVEKYVRSQEAHHRKETFKEEYRSFLGRYKIQYDEKYVWY